MGAPGLATATALGAWINVVGLLALAWRGGWFRPDALLGKVAAATLVAGGALALVLVFGSGAAARLTSGLGSFADIASVAILGIAELVVYGFIFLVACLIFGIDLARLRPPRRSKKKAGP